jgi:hypothetical protein
VLAPEIECFAGVVARLFEGVTDHLEPLGPLAGDDETDIASVAPTSSDPQLASGSVQKYPHFIRIQKRALPD